ncbi:MAG: glycosyltransferase family 39 protein [Verrucomicrobiae bacterium]|nr:glycosyltransferase family 39 protein [Verrucomicrobiae bacterium]
MNLVEIPPAHRRVGNLWLGLIAAVTVGLYVGASFGPAIYDETEGQYSGAAKEMLARGDWLVPTNNGVPRFQKPPLVYWAIMASMSVFGVNEFGARLPNALATLGWLWATYLLGARIGGRGLGIFSALALGSACGFFVFCHLIMPEPYLACFVTLAMWCFFSAWALPAAARGWFAWAWVFMGLATMSKGVHGAAYPLLAVAASVAMRPRQARFWLGLLSWRGLLLFAMIVVPWYAALEWRYPGFAWDHFVNEQLGHSLNKRWPPTSNQVSPVVFVVQHVFFLVPAALFAPMAWLAWRRCEHARRLDDFSKHLLGCWFLVTFGTSFISARQDYYTMSAWSAAAVWLALPWASPVALPRRGFVIPLAALVLAGALGLVAAHVISAAPGGVSVQAVPMEERDHLWTAIQGFSMNAWKRFVPLLQGTSVSFVAGGLAAIAWLWRGNRMAAGLAVAGMMAVPLLCAAKGFCLKQDYFSLVSVARSIDRAGGEGAIAVYHGEPNLASSLFFYLGRKVHWVGARPNADFAPRKLGVGRELYLSEGDLAARWKGGGRVFLVTEESSVAGWAERLGLSDVQRQPVGRSGTRVALCNDPLVMRPEDRGPPE